MYADELTKLGNRRCLFDQVPNIVTECQRTHLPLSLGIFDLDGLKSIDDEFGHAMGDRALARVATARRAQVRSVDVVARMRGDEFVVLMPDATEEQAAVIAERIRRTLTRTRTRRPCRCPPASRRSRPGTHCCMPLRQRIARCTRRRSWARSRGSLLRGLRINREHAPRVEW